MNRSQELELLDYACKTTIAKETTTGKTQVQEDINNAIKYYVKKGQPQGFTRTNGARNYVETLNKDIIEKELLLNIVKINALKDFNHEATLLSVNKSFNDDLSIDELEFLTYKLIEKYDISSVRALFESFPDKYEQLVRSFVYRRYFDSLHNADTLDDQQIMTWEYAAKQGKIESAFGVAKSY